MSSLTIPHYYADKTILITGATGCIGKVLIEKLLRSCPQVKRIYVLLRAKKGRAMQERIDDMLKASLFDLVRKDNPHQFDKLVPIQADSLQPNFGLNDHDIALIQDQVQILFHGAASVRFDDPLDIAILQNTRGTREIAKIALGMPKLETFVHISTTYCNCDRSVVYEQLYPAPMHWAKAIDMAENVERPLLNIFCKKFLDRMPNTYTFAKALSEHVVNDLLATKVPVIIYRPSIVVCSYSDPFPGWNDSFNGLLGILAGCSSGTVLTFYAPEECVNDNIPIDYVARGLIIAAWDQVNNKSKEEQLEAAVYNCSNNGYYLVQLKDIYQLGEKMIQKYPLDNMVMYPHGRATNCFYYYYLQTVIFQLIPAVCIDLLLRILKMKPFLFNVQRRIYVANVVLHYFVINQWEFINEKFRELTHTRVLPEDDADFGNGHYLTVNPSEFIVNGMLGVRRYLFKQKDEDLPAARRRARRLEITQRILKYSFYFLIAYIIYKYYLIDLIASFQ